MPSAVSLARRRIEAFFNEAMIHEMADTFKALSNSSRLRKWVRAFDRDVSTLHWEHCYFIEAALYEIIAFIARRDARIARTAALMLDPHWIELEEPEDYLLVFDKA